MSITRLKSAVAEYNHLSQTISLNNVSSGYLKKFTELIKSGKSKESAETLDYIKNIHRPLIHELRHWFDMTCTTQGLETLESIFKINSNKYSKLDVEKLKRDLGTGIFIEKSNTPPPWAFKITRSYPKFHENHAHFSVCFLKPNDPTETTRFKSPIYLGSILECCAYFQEYRDSTPLAFSNQNFFIEEKDFKEEELNFVYSAHLANYHCLPHILANAASTEDMNIAFKLAASICFLLMNSSNSMNLKLLEEAKAWFFENYKITPKNQEIYNKIMYTWVKESMIYMYFLKILNSKKETVSDLYIFSLFETTKAIQKDFFEIAKKVYIEKIKELTKLNVDYFNDCQELLIENNNICLNQKSLSPSLIKIKRPPIYLSDGILNSTEHFNKLEDYYLSINERSFNDLISIKESSSNS